MYKRRLQIFIFLCILAVSVCGVRLIYLQLIRSQYYRDQIAQELLLAPMQLPTIRGSILDRNGNFMAVDKPVFYLEANYELTRLLDDRFWEGSILKRVTKEKNKEQAELQLRKECQEDYSRLAEIIDKCAKIKNTTRADIDKTIRDLNDQIWQMREFFAWLWKFPDSELRAEFRAKGRSVPRNRALKDFQEQVPVDDERVKLAMDVDLSIMHQGQPLIELNTDRQLLEAQLEFVNTEGTEIVARAKRVYPYDSAACQVIGWVGPAQQEDRKLFADDDYSQYLSSDVSGKDGVEKISEVILRGRRGEVTYDKDGKKIEWLVKPTQFGQDVHLSLDIELQQNIESFLRDPNLNPNYGSATGAVVIDVASGDILVMVSMPVYDLNTIRQRYNRVRDAAGAPFINKSLYELYPPGSTIKPIILIAGLEGNKIGSNEMISCPFKDPPGGWPKCIMFRNFDSCCDWRWDNYARNAIRGSCNVYFSQLADRLESRQLQKWLYSFGYGRKILPGPSFDEKLDLLDRKKGIGQNLRQSAGQISTKLLLNPPYQFDDIPKLAGYEKRMFGIGQGGFRSTVLQVANAMAAISRGGIYKSPRLFLSENANPGNGQFDLGISEDTLAVVRDGMMAVTTETGGTAYNVFRYSPLLSRGIKIYGKTGSTEKPFHAWFAGFTEDQAGRAISLAIVVEGGQSGAGDAAPLGREMIRFCNEAGYIGQMPTDQEPD